MADEDLIHELKDEKKDEWLDIDGVEALTVHEDYLCICVSDPDMTSPVDAVGTDEVDGVPLDVMLTGEFTALDQLDAEAVEDATYTNRYRPVVAGVSVAHEQLGGSGTNGFAAYDPDNPGRRYCFSNNHVVANCNDAQQGDAVHQPSRAHGGDKAGELAGFVPLEDGVTVDAAWYEPNTNPDPSIHNLEDPTGAVRTRGGDFTTGEEFTCSGLTTGVTAATLQQKNAAVNIRYGEPLGTVRVDNCLITGNMSKAGDSGSPVIDEDGNPAGLVFAGNGGDITIVSPADRIEALSGLKMYRSEADLPGNDDGEEFDGRATTTLEMQRTAPDRGRLTVHTVDAATGDPLSGVSVDVSHSDGGGQKTTDREGKVFFTVGLSEPVSVAASHDDYEDAQISIPTEEFQ